MLIDVLHVLNIRKNFTLGLLLVKSNMKLVINVEKVILRKWSSYGEKDNSRKNYLHSM